MQFVDAGAMTRWVRETGAERIIAELVGELEGAFRRWESYERFSRLASHSPSGVIELMPAADAQHYGFKYVNGHPSNPARGLQTVTAFGVLSDVPTGYPLLLCEMTLLTALRTAAMSGLASTWLADPHSTRLALIGAGSQAVFQALAVRGQLPGVRTVRVVDIDPRAAATATARLNALGFDAAVAETAAAACREAEVITTCTADRAHRVVLRAGDVAPGARVNAIGGDCPGKTELDPELLKAHPVFVEHEPQTRLEGEIQLLDPTHPVTELWRVITGARSGRSDPQQITVFDSVGFAVEDLVALQHVHRATAGTEHSEPIDLIAPPEDPKDLYGLLR